ncbi:MAG: HPF/RaiA family ribosome-associated protein [Vicinamibacterales bacterium]
MLPVDVVFRNMRRRVAAEARIRERAAALAGLYERIERCRVVVEVPHRHHEAGNHYQLRIELAVPGRDLVIDHDSSRRTRLPGETTPHKRSETAVEHRRLQVAVHDAFDAAERRLKRLVERRRPKAKAAKTPRRGTAQ